jgi:hypothetical protein
MEEAGTTNEPRTTGIAMVTAEIEAKLKAILGYDEILWKIRAGYVGILYGSFALILGTNGIGQFSEFIADARRIRFLLLLVVGFSVSAAIVDITYLYKKVKVIVSRDYIHYALLKDREALRKHLLVLMTISGEVPLKDLPTRAKQSFLQRFPFNVMSETLFIYGMPVFLSLLLSRLI